MMAILAWESPFEPKEKYTHLGFGFYNAPCEMCNLVISAHLGFTCRRRRGDRPRNVLEVYSLLREKQAM
jgi:hypothetical protein